MKSAVQHITLRGGAYRLQGDALQHAPLNVDGSVDADAWYDTDENGDDQAEIALARTTLMAGLATAAQ